MKVKKQKNSACVKIIYLIILVTTAWPICKWKWCATCRTARHEE